MEVTKVKSKTIIGNSHILKPGYHMNFGKKRIEKAIYNKFPFESLGNVSASVFTGGIFKRVFVDDPEYGHPYISAQHMMNSNPLDVAKIISKKYTPRQEEMSLKENQILVSCAGTIGNVRLITKDLTGVIGSQDIIRVDPNNTKLSYGYLYAYLASKTAYNYMQSYIYGSVVPRIEPKTLSRLPIPILTAEKQQKIHQLIVEASELRVLANSLLQEAIQIFEQELSYSEINNGAQCGKISSKELMDFHKRLDSQYQLIWKRIKKEYNSNIQFDKIRNIASSIFVGGRGKRNYVENGIPFLSSSDMMLFNPIRLSKKISPSTNGVEQMKVSKKDILISRSGTVGNTVIVGDDLSNVAISEHALRLIINSDKISPNYVFAFLKTNMGLKAIEASAFGSVIITLNEDLIGNIDLPILTEELQKLISDKVEEYISFSDKSVVKENQAIALIEKEIDLWQVS